jgi:hypothetical protein
MRHFAVSAVRSYISFILVVAVLVMAASLLSGWRAGAESVVQALVCSQSASLTITQPASDSVVALSPLGIKGTVSQANQIEVYVDSVFSSVVPLSASTTSYETNVALTTGTHTVKLIAVDACQIENGEATIVVTYQPAVTQSAGSDTATRISGGGVVVGQAVDPVASESNTLLDRIVLQPLRNLGAALDLTPVTTAPRQEVISPTGRLLLLASGVTILIFSSALLDLRFISKPLAALGSHLGLRSHHGGHLLILVIGGALTLLPFLL